MVGVNYSLAPDWSQKLKSGECTQKEVYRAMQTYNNVAQEIRMELSVIK